MARIYGLNGVLRGKQGNNVFSVQNGTQVVKAYQPVVSNPRSLPQQLQRAKFALAGRLSSIVPSGALVGLGGENSRSRRAAFVASVVNTATVTSTPSGSGQIVQATITYEGVRFSEGSLSRYSPMTLKSAAYTGTAGAYRLSVTISGYGEDPIQSDAPTGYGELVICLMINPANSSRDACQYAIRSSADLTFNFAVLSRLACHVAVYVVPFAPVDAASAYGVSQYLANLPDSIAQDMLAKTFLAGMKFGTSALTFTRDIAASSSMVAPSPDDDTRKKK